MKRRGVFSKVKYRNFILFIVLVLSLTAILAMMYMNYERTYKNAKGDVIELSKNSSAKNAETFELFIKRHEDILLSASDLVKFGLTDKGAKQGDIEKLLYNISETYNDSVYRRATGEDFTGIYAAIDGTLVHAYKSTEDLPAGFDPTTRPWYKEAQAGGGQTVFGEPYIDINNSDMYVITASKMLQDGKTVVGMDVTIDSLQRIGGNINMQLTLNGVERDYGYGFLISNKGVVMAHSDEAYLGQDYGDPNSPMHKLFLAVKECDADASKDYIETEVDGVPYGVFPKKLSNGWYVVTMTELDNIKTVISEFSKSTLIGTIIIAVLALGYCISILAAYVKAETMAEDLHTALDLATTDSLTGLNNRTAYDIRCKELSQQMGSDDDKPFALVMMDLNDLKNVNDNHGHEAGDQYIINSCNLVQGIFDCDIYRIGGDEFAVFLTGEKFNEWETLCSKLRQKVAKANLNMIANVDEPGISLGVAVHQLGDDANMDNLQRNADVEMYSNKVAIKQARLNRSKEGYSADVKIQLQEKQFLLSEIQKALKEGQFEVWFQPQVNHANNGNLIGAEALVRWRHPEKGMISPAVFIPVFEYNGLIYELDKYVWRKTCELVRSWIDSGLLPLPVSINVSRLDLTQPDFIETITALINEHNLPLDIVHLEVTESALSEDTGKVIEVVNELINMGFIIAIDDFGSGYSSLGLLRKLPAHIVKLDMSFFADDENRARNECIIESVIRMIKMLGMAVLAEGVETIEQAELLKKLGCAYIQGYLYSKPLPYKEFVEYVKSAVSERVARVVPKTNRQIDDGAAPSHELFHDIVSGTNDDKSEILFTRRLEKTHIEY